MMNKVTLIGRLGAEPEQRDVNGKPVTNLRIATSETWRDRDSGDKREKTEWHRVTVWGEGKAKYLGYAKKGTLLLVEGKLETRKWTDQQGVEKFSTEVVVTDFNGELQILADGVERN